MSRHKPPKNTALKDALKAAVKSSSSDVDDANSPPAASSGTNIFRSLFEPDSNFKVHSAKPRVRKERRKVRRKKKVRRLQGGPTQPSYAAIRSAYGGNIKAPRYPAIRAWRRNLILINLSTFQVRWSINPSLPQRLIGFIKAHRAPNSGPMMRLDVLTS